jgi:hypothetical protein
MATCEGCCHLTGAILNLAAEAADRARIWVWPAANFCPAVMSVTYNVQLPARCDSLSFMKGFRGGKKQHKHEFLRRICSIFGEK